MKVRIVQSSDDAVQDVLTTTNGDSTTYYCDDSTEPLIGYHISFGNIMLGLRFQNVNIPTNVIIDSVMITFTSGGNTTGTNTFLKINGENQNSPVTFPQAAGSCSAYDESWDATSNIYGRTLLADTINWSVTSNWEKDSTYSTPDIKNIFQSIIDRSGWGSSDKSMVFVLQDDGSQAGYRSIKTYESLPAKAPQLTIYYTPVVFSDSLSTHIISSSITHPRSVYAADVNNDGEMDVLSISQEWNNAGSIVYWHKNNGDGSFETNGIKQFTSYIHTIIASDLDSDGDMDILHPHTGGSTLVSWYKNNGDGSFDEIEISYDVQDGAHNIYTIDLDQDGDMDIITNEHGSVNIRWHENNGNENFTQHIIDNNSQNTRSIIVEDIDRDGDLDVISISQQDVNRITWYLNDGNENFTPTDIYTSTEFEPNSIDAVDLNEDGYMDIIFAANNYIGTKGKVLWFENINGGSFIEHEIATIDERFYNIKASDIDGDGDIDIILSQNWHELGWYQNDGSENFISVLVAKNLPANSFYILDLDGDGDIDIASVNENDQVAWHENLSTCSSTYDCAGECGGSDTETTYYYDYDQDGHGSSISAGRLCSNHQWVKQGFVVNNKLDSYNDCTCPVNDSTCLDLCGACNGGASNAADCFQFDANWVFCSMEGEDCDFLGRREVRYGVINCDGQIVNEYVSGRFKNNVFCDYVSFGVEDLCSDTQKYCIYSADIYGCTDEDAENFDPFAETDDGSCCLSLDENNHCTDDINILQAFIDNSSDFGDESNHTLNLENDENGNGIIEVSELGVQEWVNGRLEYWKCDNCGLSGNIPSEINGLYALASLDLSFNSLSGSIPENLGLMVHLNNINLSNNYLSGSVPNNTIARLYRYFQNNQVSFGNFPEVLNERLGDNSICVNTYEQYSLDNQRCEPAFEIIYPINDMLLILNSTSDIIPVRILGLNFIINDVKDGIDGHFHYAVDIEEGIGSPKFSSDFDLTFAYPGDHVLKMTLVDDDHFEFDPSIQKEVKFSVYHRNAIPKLISIVEPEDQIISFNDEMIELVFSMDLHAESDSAINVTNALGNIEYHWDASVGKNGDSTIISITLDELASGDQITLSLNPAEIRPNGDEDYVYIMSHLYPDTIFNWTYNVEYLGDYNHSGYGEDGIIIDHGDIDTLVQHWGGNSDDDYRYELGPCWNGNPCQPQDAPYLHADFDQIWDIEDLQTLMIMWNHSPPPSGGRVSAKEAMAEQGMQPTIQFENENLVMKLPKYNQSIRHIWFQVYIPEDSRLIYTPTSFSGQFDMALHRDYPEESIVQWSLVDLEGEWDLEDIMLGMVETAEQSNQSLEVQYKLTSKEGILSSGTLALNYLPIPDDFELSQAYPNPFNPSTTVQYALPAEVYMNLSVFDVLGRKVFDVTSGFKSAGYYEAVWDGSNHSSGLYFIRMNAYGPDNTLRFNKLQKIMLVK